MGYVTEVWVWGNRILIKFHVNHNLEEQLKCIIFKCILQLLLVKTAVYSENHKKKE
jgi:hypothetical protein